MSYGVTFPLLRKAAGAHWPDYTEHAFVAGLGDGTLPRVAYLRYLVQDYLYLIQYGRAWALAVTMADTLEDMRACAKTVQTLIGTEIHLHVQTCGAAGISEAALFASEEKLETIAYTRFVLDAGHSGDFLDLLMALAPCAFGYAVDDHIDIANLCLGRRNLRICVRRHYCPCRFEPEIAPRPFGHAGQKPGELARIQRLANHASRGKVDFFRLAPDSACRSSGSRCSRSFALLASERIGIA